MVEIHHCQMVTTDASLTDWGMVFEGRPACGVWTREFLSWHINFLALIHFLTSLRGVSCDCQDGQHGGSIPYKLPGEFMVAHPKQACTPSPTLDSGQVSPLRAVHVPGVLNLAANFLSRQKLRSGEWTIKQ